MKLSSKYDPSRRKNLYGIYVYLRTKGMTFEDYIGKYQDLLNKGFYAGNAIRLINKKHYE